MNEQAPTDPNVSVPVAPRLKTPSYSLEQLRAFGFDSISAWQIGWATLCNAVFRNAQNPITIMSALSRAKAQGLNIFDKPFDIVIMNKGRQNEQEVIWETANYHRLLAEMSGNFGGFGEATYSDELYHFKHVFAQGTSKEWVIEYEVAAWISVPVIKIVNGKAIESAGVRIYAKEYARATTVWQSMPNYMLGKTAESASLRRTFPMTSPTVSEIDKMLGDSNNPVQNIVYPAISADLEDEAEVEGVIDNVEVDVESEPEAELAAAIEQNMSAPPPAQEPEIEEHYPELPPTLDRRPPPASPNIPQIGEEETSETEEQEEEYAEEGAGFPEI